MKSTSSFSLLLIALLMSTFPFFFIKLPMLYHDHGVQHIFSQPARTNKDKKILVECEFGAKENCFEKFSTHLRNKSSWHFFGDSNMIYTFNKIKYPRKVTSDKRNKRGFRGRCGFLDYVNISKRKKWVQPNPLLLQGPIDHGLKNPYCTDLMGTLYRMTSENRTHFIEFLTVEFANDVAHQSAVGNTTQETVSKYLAMQIEERRIPREQSVCVASTGLHDQALCPGLNSEVKCRDLYLFNVKKYLNLLSIACGNIVWVSQTHVNETGGYIQRNSRSKSWDDGVKSLLEKMTISNFFFLDILNFSSQFEHVDNVHFKGKYYDTMASFWTHFL